MRRLQRPRAARRDAGARASGWAAEKLATGHYARLAETGDQRGPLLRTAADPAKDQTYMLAALAPASLARMRFPLGELHKPQVRELAAAAGLPVAAKADSQDLCFLAGTDPGALPGSPRPASTTGRGRSSTTDGTVLAGHLGQHRFTVGQRRGLGVVGGEPLYVLDKDPTTERVTVGPRAALSTARVAVRGARLHRPGSRVNRVKLRYRSRPLHARLAGDPAAGRHRALSIELDDPVDGAAPGQLACLMDRELVVGWGTIARPSDPRIHCGVPMTSDEIRRTYIEFFEQRGHLRLPSSLADPGRARPLGAVHGRGHAAAQALLPRRRAPARTRA